MHHGTSLVDATRLWRTPDVPHDGGVRTHTTSAGHGHQLTIAEQAEQQWPTPAARDYKGTNGPDHLDAGTGKKHLAQLQNFVEYLFSPQAPAITPAGNACSPSAPSLPLRWPTPDTQAANDGETPETWHTRSTRLQAKQYNGNGQGRKLTVTSVEHSRTSALAKPKLNPQFVEWLMGLPIGWTGFAPVATAWSHWRSRMRFALSRLEH